MKLLIAGASGIVGREVARQAVADRLWIRTLTRARPPDAAVHDAWCADATDRAQLAGVCDGIDVVFSCLGAPVGMARGDRRGFDAIDRVGNSNLLSEAQRAGVGRMVYVSVHHDPHTEQTAYVSAHERFVGELSASGLSHTIVRPTGIFASLGELVAIARRGRVPVVGDGSPRTNPIHEADLAAVCCDLLVSGPRSVDVGGPEVLTRREIAELACAALGRPTRTLRIPRWAMRLGAALIRLAHPRIGQFLDFGALVMSADCVAPAAGSRRIGDYFRELASKPC
jgi:uncharacterized protein YbjT (DUF2867 family)